MFRRFAKAALITRICFFIAIAFYARIVRSLSALKDSSQEEKFLTVYSVMKSYSPTTALLVNSPYYVCDLFD